MSARIYRLHPGPAQIRSVYCAHCGALVYRDEQAATTRLAPQEITSCCTAVCLRAYRRRVSQARDAGHLRWANIERLCDAQDTHYFLR